MNTCTDQNDDKSAAYKEGLVAQQATQLVWLVPQVVRQLGMTLLDSAVPDMTLRQLHVCILLESGPMMISEIGKQLEFSRSAATQIADRLEKAGIVERIPTGQDHRAKFLRLTSQGSDRMQRWRQQQFRQTCSVLSHLSLECRAEVLRALTVLATATEEASSPVVQMSSRYIR